MDDIQYKLETLYFYWVNCDDVWFYAHQKTDFQEILPEELHEFARVNHAFYRLIIAYGLLYVVLEAYQQLKISDKGVDLLLKKTEYVDQLKRLRNGVFHYQEDFMDADKVMNFINMKASHIWVNDLKNAFEHFFVNKFPLIRLMKNKIRADREKK